LGGWEFQRVVNGLNILGEDEKGNLGDEWSKSSPMGDGFLFGFISF
jgi:hypothetical protein